MKMKASSILTAALAAPMFLVVPGVASAGWAVAGVNGLVGDGPTRVRIPDNVTSGGITHELTPGDWFAYRVKVVHDDSINPFGWASDNFAPTSGNIQICDITGCEAPSIETSNENLDWSDRSKITVVLQAKTGLLAPWQSFSLSWQ